MNIKYPYFYITLLLFTSRQVKPFISMSVTCRLNLNLDGTSTSVELQGLEIQRYGAAAAAGGHVVDRINSHHLSPEFLFFF